MRSTTSRAAFAPIRVGVLHEHVRVRTVHTGISDGYARLNLKGGTYTITVLHR